MAIRSRKRQTPDSAGTPILSRLEERVLRQIIEWADSYKAAKESGQRTASQYVPTTERCSTHFNVEHSEMLALLNQFQALGLVEKRRRISAGVTGNGYDGSLHSEVMPTERGRNALLQNANG
jgi:hypothetical protein